MEEHSRFLALARRRRRKEARIGETQNPTFPQDQEGAPQVPAIHFYTISGETGLQIGVSVIKNQTHKKLCPVLVAGDAVQEARRVEGSALMRSNERNQKTHPRALKGRQTAGQRKARGLLVSKHLNTQRTQTPTQLTKDMTEGSGATGSWDFCLRSEGSQSGKWKPVYSRQPQGCCP